MTIDVTDNAWLVLQAIASVREAPEQKLVQNMFQNALLGYQEQYFPAGSKGAIALMKRMQDNFKAGRI